jgi:hypothetical protein
MHNARRSKSSASDRIACNITKHALRHDKEIERKWYIKYYFFQIAQGVPHILSLGACALLLYNAVNSYTIYCQEVRWQIDWKGIRRNQSSIQEFASIRIPGVLVNMSIKNPLQCKYIYPRGQLWSSKYHSVTCTPIAKQWLYKQCPLLGDDHGIRKYMATVIEKQLLKQICSHGNKL